MVSRLRIAAVAAAAATVLTLPAAAQGAVTVLGTSAARACFEAADAKALPTPRQIERCNAALAGEALSDYEVVATHVNRGILRLRRGDTAGAIADFDRAMTLDPGQPEAYLNKGAALIRLQDAQGALPLFTMALERNTRRPEVAHYGRAVAAEALGNLAQAYADYSRASELSPAWEDPRAELSRFRLVPRE
jgi:tetratricopeptide (TPR) repeat protein